MSNDNSSAEQGLVQSFRIIKHEFERLEEHIVGNPAYGNPGLVGQIKINEQRIDNVEDEMKHYSKKIDDLAKENFKQKATVAAVAGAAGAATGWGLKAGLAKIATFLSMMKP